MASREQAQALAVGLGLNQGQTSALMHMATSRDAVVLVQGNAGVGKTYPMRALKDLIEAQEQGVIGDEGNSPITPTQISPSSPSPPSSPSYPSPSTLVPIRGLAPSAAAADVLQTESGISSQTLASYLLTPNERLPHQEVILVDEAGMLSTKQVQQLLEKAQATNSRVILVGDTKQLSAVEAGAPFKLLQDQGLSTAIIDQNLRQRDPSLKQVVDLMATHDHNQDSVNQAYQKLHNQGKIQQITADKERREAMAADYLSRPVEVRDRTLILAGTNADKQALAQTVRQGLISEGALGSENLQIQTLRRKDLDQFALNQSHHYQRGDVIKFQVDSTQFSRDLYYRVTAVNPSTNTVSLIDTAGVDYTLPLDRYFQREVYQLQQREIRPGEQMRFTKNSRNQDYKQLNGQWFTVEGWTDDSQISIKTKGQSQNVPPEQLLHSDYRYVDTVHSSQGRTADYCIYSASLAKSLTIGRESFYVAASRARQEFVIYTASVRDLGVTVQMSRANENALDLVQNTTSQAIQNNPSKAAQKASSQAELQSNPSLALTDTEKSITSDESVRRDGGDEREREVTNAATNIVERLQGITENLTDSSRRAAELAEQLRGASREAEAIRRDVTGASAETENRRRDESGTNREAGDPRNRPTDPNRPAAELTREFHQLSERARGPSGPHRKARKSATAKLGELAAQFKQGIQEFIQSVAGSDENLEELQIRGAGMAGQGDSGQTAGISQEYLGDSSIYQPGDLGVQPNFPAPQGASQPDQWSGQQYRDSAEAAGPIDLFSQMTPQQWDQDLAEKAREDLKPSEYRSPEELELIIATYAIGLQFPQSGIREILKESERIQSWRELQRKGLISATEAEIKAATYPQEISELAWGLLQREPEAQEKYQRLQQRPAVVATVRKLLEHSGQETESGILTFEGRRYQMIGTKNLQNVGIVAKDGRGLILSLKNGVLEGMLTESDLEVFRHLEQALEEYLAKNERSPSRERQPTKERDRGWELE